MPFDWSNHTWLLLSISVGGSECVDGMKSDLFRELEHGGLIPVWNVVLHLLRTGVLEFYCTLFEVGSVSHLCMNYSPSMVLKYSSETKFILSSPRIQYTIVVPYWELHATPGTFTVDLTMWGLTGQDNDHIPGQMVRVGVSIWETVVCSNTHFSALGCPLALLQLTWP